MPYIDEGVIQYAIYENESEFLGVAEVTLPTISQKSITVSGAGISGDVEAPIIGQVAAMRTTITWRTTTKDTYRLYEPYSHHLELRIALQQKNSGGADMIVVPEKIIIVGRPMEMSRGAVTPASMLNTSVSLGTEYYASYLKGKETLRIDPYNNVYVVNGIDYAAGIRQALGKA